MPVSAVGSIQAPATTASETRSLESLNYNAFLNLLVAEMKNQDPTKPTDTSQYMAQLASFASVEQGIQTNARLDKIISSLGTVQATGVIGKLVTSSDGAISGIAESVQYFADSVSVKLTDGSTIKLGPGVTVAQP